MTRIVAEANLLPQPFVRRWWALAALATAMLTIGVDATVLNVALPTLSTSLHASTEQLQWFSAAYTLVLGALIIPVGSLGDRFGRKRLLVGGLMAFGMASVACAFAPSAGVLSAARAIQGLGGAAMLPLSLAMLPVLFEDTHERARAMTIWVASSTIGLPLGPLVGGWLLQHFWWGSVFLINVPLVGLGIVALLLFLPESRRAQPQPTDIFGIALSSAGLTCVIYGFIGAGQRGWAATPTWLPILAGAGLLTLFVGWEHRAAHPLIDADLFSNRNFVCGTALSTVANFAFFGLLFAVPQYFQDVKGADPLATGVRLLPMIAGMIAGTQLTLRFSKRLGARFSIVVGFTCAGAALTVAATTDVDSGYPFAAVWITGLGVGLGLAFPAAMTSAIGALSADRAGAGSGLLQALRQLGGALGVAVLGTVLSSGYRHQLDTSHLASSLSDTARSSVGGGVQVARQLRDSGLTDAVRAAFVHGMSLTLVVSAVLTFTGALAALVYLPGHPANLGGERR